MGNHSLLVQQSVIQHTLQVVLEMVELREVDIARAMLRQTPVFNRMKQEEPDRFLKLEHLCGRTYFDIRQVRVQQLVHIKVAARM